MFGIIIAFVRLVYYPVCMAEAREKDERVVRIGARIADFRQDRGLSQEMLAARVTRLGIRPLSRVTLAQYETGSVEPSATRLLDIANAFGCTVSALTGDEREAESDTAFYDEDWSPEERRQARRAAKNFVQMWREERRQNG